MEYYKIWSEWTEQSISAFYNASITFMPKLVMAFIILLTGWIIAKLLQTIIVRVSKRLDKMVKDSSPKLHTKWPISSIVGAAVYWLVLLFFLTMASETLGLPKLSTFLRQIFGYLPSFVTGAAIIFVGYVLSLKARDTLRHSELDHGELLGQGAWLIILVFSIILGTAQLGLDTTLLVNLVTIIVAMLFGGAALAFGLGAGVSVSNIMASHYIKKTYTNGQKIKVCDHIGIITEITPTTVVIETENGKMIFPAKLFSETSVEHLSEF